MAKIAIIDIDRCLLNFHVQDDANYTAYLLSQRIIEWVNENKFDYIYIMTNRQISTHSNLLDKAIKISRDCDKEFKINRDPDYLFTTSIVSNFEKVTGRKITRIATPEDKELGCGSAYHQRMAPYELSVMMYHKHEGLYILPQMAGIDAFPTVNKNGMLKQIFEYAKKHDKKNSFYYVDDEIAFLDSASKLVLPPDVKLNLFYYKSSIPYKNNNVKPFLKGSLQEEKVQELKAVAKLPATINSKEKKPTQKSQECVKVQEKLIVEKEQAYRKFQAKLPVIKLQTSPIIPEQKPVIKFPVPIKVQGQKPPVKFQSIFNAPVPTMTENLQPILKPKEQTHPKTTLTSNMQKQLSVKKAPTSRKILEQKIFEVTQTNPKIHKQQLVEKRQPSHKDIEQEFIRNAQINRKNPEQKPVGKVQLNHKDREQKPVKISLTNQIFQEQKSIEKSKFSKTLQEQKNVKQSQMDHKISELKPVKKPQSRRVVDAVLNKLTKKQRAGFTKLHIESFSNELSRWLKKQNRVIPDEILIEAITPQFQTCLPLSWFFQPQATLHIDYPSLEKMLSVKSFHKQTLT